MSSLLDRAYEIEEERRETEQKRLLKIEQIKKVCPGCGCLHQDETIYCFDCMYITCMRDGDI